MKRIFFVLFAVAVVFGLCACNDSNTDTPSIEDVSVNDISNDDTVPESSCDFESSSDVEDSSVFEESIVSENDESDDSVNEESDISEEASFDEESESEESFEANDTSESESSAEDVSKSEPKPEPEPDDEDVEMIEYTISVRSLGGIGLSGLDINIYKGSDLKDLKMSTKITLFGSVSVNLPKSDDYYVVVSGAPKGYKVEKSYRFVGQTAAISLESSLVKGEDITATTLGVGDVMYDFTVIDADGKEVKLSEVLKKKKFVVLNYWYTSCHWCIEEFYVIQELYGDYKDDIEFIAINPINDADAVKDFRDRYGYSFPMASCDYSWASVFGVTGYPTSVFIDRYGTIVDVERGAIITTAPWVYDFEYYTGDNY